MSGNSVIYHHSVRATLGGKLRKTSKFFKTVYIKRPQSKRAKSVGNVTSLEGSTVCKFMARPEEYGNGLMLACTQAYGAYLFWQVDVLH